MKKLVFLIPVMGAIFLVAADESKIPPTPIAVTSNAVASLKSGTEVYSIMGVGTKKNWDDVTNKMFLLRFKSGRWYESRPVPGVAGRLGSSAVGAKGEIFVFGGYTVDGQGNEYTLGDVNAFIPEDQKWYRAADIPVPVDSAVIGLDHDRYVYLIGGRTKNGPVNKVQVYDTERNTWDDATPFPGTPVYGHAGGIADGTIVFIDGAKKNTGAGAPYIASDECWMGKIDHKDPTKIVWSKLPPHPGTARFGIVAGAGEKEHKVIFSGGSASPHNFKGLDFEGKPTDISPLTFAFELHGNHWETYSADTFDVRSDSRGILITRLGPMVLGGMVKDQNVTGMVVVLPKHEEEQ